MVDVGHTAAQKVTGQNQTARPQEAADDVVSGEFFIAHGADAGDHGHKGAHDRHKTGQNYGFAAVFGKK